MSTILFIYVLGCGYMLACFILDPERYHILSYLVVILLWPVLLVIGLFFRLRRIGDR